MTTDDFLRQATNDIIHILTKPPNTTFPTLKAGDPTRNALLEVATLLNRVDKLHIENDSERSQRVQSRNEQSQRVRDERKQSQRVSTSNRSTLHWSDLGSRKANNLEESATTSLHAQHLFQANHIYNDQEKK